MDQRKLPTAITESDYDIINHPRTYMYFEQPVLYPFGYGPSYTQFEYSILKLSSDKINKDGELKVQFSIKNSGKMNGDEIAQVYVHASVVSQKIIEQVISSN